jgi:hypothetical protein
VSPQTGKVTFLKNHVSEALKCLVLHNWNESKSSSIKTEKQGLRPSLLPNGSIPPEDDKYDLSSLEYDAIA